MVGSLDAATCPIPILENDSDFILATDADDVLPTVCHVDVGAFCPGQERGPTLLP